MPPPSDRRTPRAPVRAEPRASARSEARAPVRADPRAQDRTIRALMSVVDDLTVEREEAGLVRSTLEHVVVSLGLTGGVTFLLGPDETLNPGAELGLPEGQRDAALTLALLSLERGRPAVRELEAAPSMPATPPHPPPPHLPTPPT